MQNKLNLKLIEIFKILSLSSKLQYIHNNSIAINNSNATMLLSIGEDSIEIPLPDFQTTFTKHISKLDDNCVDLKLLETLITTLEKDKKIVRLNHVGFCYKVDSINKEVERITQMMNGSEFKLYEEPSNDKSRWLFIGDFSQWSEPLIELLPVEDTTDQWVDYWLPHIQIDIDTLLSPVELQSYIEKIFQNKIKPFAIKIEGITYMMRCRLCTASGININLDLATNNRNVKFHRENILRRIN